MALREKFAWALIDKISTLNIQFHGIRHVPEFTETLANIFTPYSVGDRDWCRSISILTGPDIFESTKNTGWYVLAVSGEKIQESLESIVGTLCNLLI
jgi:hypothetical protein